MSEQQSKTGYLYQLGSNEPNSKVITLKFDPSRFVRKKLPSITVIDMIPVSIGTHPAQTHPQDSQATDTDCTSGTAAIESTAPQTA